MMLFIAPLLSVVLFANSGSSPLIDLALLKSALFGWLLALVVVGLQLVRFTRTEDAKGKSA